MSVVIPNFSEAPATTFNAAAVRDRTDDYAARSDGQTTGVVSGMGVTASGSLTLTVASGQVYVRGVSYLYTGGTVPVVTNLGLLDRRDVVVYRVGTGIVVLQGSTGSYTPGSGVWTVSSAGNAPLKPDINEATDVVLCEVYMPYNATTVTAGLGSSAGYVIDKSNVLFGVSLPQPNSSRLIDWGHSWVAPVPGPYNESNIGGVGGPTTYTSYLTNLNQWPNALRDALGIGGTLAYTKSYVVPAVGAGSSTTTFLDVRPDDGTIDSVYYVPNAALTGANTNTRAVTINAPNWASAINLGGVQFNSGTSLVQYVGYRIWDINDNIGIQSAAGVVTNAISPYFPSLRGVLGATLQQPQEVTWTSSKVGTGLADPGGTVIIRYGSRYRNYAVGGACLLGNPSLAQAGNQNAGLGPQSGSWVTCFEWSPHSRPNAIEVNLSASSSLNSGSISVSYTRYPIAAGAIINFPNGGTFTVTSAQGYGTTGTISGTGPTVAQPANVQGHVQNGTGSPEYESLSPTGINVWTHGVNDAAATQDLPAWTETVRSVISRTCCSAMLIPYANSNWASVAGTGGTWTQYTVPSGGCMPQAHDSLFAGGIIGWASTGAVGGSPSMTISIGPAFEGGSVDVFFLAPAGTNLGVTASLLVDGAIPPQGAVTINTESASTSGLLTNSPTATSYSATSSATLVSSGGTPNFTANDVGKLIILSGGTGSDRKSVV